MKTRHKFPKTTGGFRQQDKMDAQAPKAAGSNAASSFRHAETAYPPLSPAVSDREGHSVGISAAASTLYRGVQDQDEPLYEERRRMNLDVGLRRLASPVGNDFQPPSSIPVPDQLVELLMSMIPESEEEDFREYGEAYQEANLWPPITKQSLSELDIQNIITNIKLRHDVSFDKDLSFRPNLDGVRGLEKKKSNDVYWKALTAELVLYQRLFQGSPSPSISNNVNWSELVKESQKRIPIMFQTLQEVLKSLVPDRDHSRVDEHLDVPMLMLQIEKGILDMPRLAQWLAQLLKEHCAPMRDEFVNEMVGKISRGATENDANEIVDGLCQLFGILEMMKLDVANHQIRNLKTLLIEDTVNFQRHYHLDRIVHRRSRVNLEAAQRWFSASIERYRQPCTPQRDNLRFKLEVFVRAVLSTFFSNDSRCEFPETFYLDHDRLRQLKSEIDDMIFFDMCFEIYEELLRRFGLGRLASHATKPAVRALLFAIVADGGCYGPARWINNCDHVAAELVQQARRTSGQQPMLDTVLTQQVTQHLHRKFMTSYARHAAIIEAQVLPEVHATITRHLQSSPIELFNSLVTHPNPPPPPHPAARTFNTFRRTSSDTLSRHSDQFADLSNRIGHILLLHWRIWGPIAYVPEDALSSPLVSSEEQLSSSPPPPALTPTPIGSASEATMVSVESPDSGQQLPTHQAPFP